MATDSAEPPKFNEILCIGLGLSGICLGVQLKRKYGFTDVHFYDRNTKHSGTWWANRYPGCACDIPAILYSFSFELNPNWPRLLPSNDEIRDYLEGVVDKYQLRPCMTFQTEVESATWDNKRQLWTVYLHDIITGERYAHECRILFSGTGSLVDPKLLDIPGTDTFRGPLFHTAKWRSDVDLQNKHVIVVGNGCSATQMVPAITSTTKTLTQFIRTPHWLLERENTVMSSNIKWAFAHVPLLMRAARVLIFMACESEWRMFYMDKSAEKLRRAQEKASTEYALRVAPKKYHDILIPNWEISCKRRVWDNDGLYLNTLNAPNFHLTKDPIVEVTPNGVRTAIKTYPADVIIAATGFQTNKGLGKLRIQGRDGILLADHWEAMGGPAAYNSTSMHGYPNFFILQGPNAATGHNSVIFAIENMVNFALKVVKPIIRGYASSVEVKREAAIDYSRRLQAASSDRVWSKGKCSTWYVTDGWNSTMYPWSQYHFWWRSTHPTWNDWDYKYTTSRKIRRLGHLKLLLLSALSLGLITAMVATQSSWQWWPTAMRSASGLLHERRNQLGFWGL